MFGYSYCRKRGLDYNNNIDLDKTVDELTSLNSLDALLCIYYAFKAISPYNVHDTKVITIHRDII